MANEKLRELLEKREELRDRLRELYAEAQYDFDVQIMYEETEAELDEVYDEIEYLRDTINM